ncbi:MAG: ATP-binding protein [Chitinophagaceae bacterium]|nr:ATP-binding protein [Chitinophagaceae bacterium]
MKINRQYLLGELTEFALEASGLVVGKPGIGKSYILKQLSRALNERSVVSLLIRIDNLVDGSDESLQRELNLSNDWISTLSQVKIDDEQKAVLIFDAFDAARDERFRKEILSQIRRAKRELSEKWNIIVSVRTYDANKSPELMRLFPWNELDEEVVSCRKLEVRELMDEEIASAVEGNKPLEIFCTEASSELKEILRVPFFLVLADKIISFNNGSNIEEAKGYRSEIQLLNKYWENKLVHIDKNVAVETILRSLIQLLVTNRSLNCSKQSFLDSNLLMDTSSLEYLRSENVLEDISVNKNRISFSHNILFDYAVSRYSLSEDYSDFLRFAREDLTRPFFLRPSFLYFFTSLWYQNRPVFWEMYWRIADETDKELRLFHRLVLNGITASEYTTIEDLHPILSVIDDNNRILNIRNLLQSIRFMQQPRSAGQSALLLQLSKKLEEAYLFEFAFLLDEFIKENNQSQNCENEGESARNLLNYILDHRSTGNKPFLDRIGATRGIELVSKTYQTNNAESKAGLTRVLDLLAEPDFEIWYFSNLSENVKHLLPLDAEFVAEIYLCIFKHSESDESRTQMGGTVLMSFTSTRKQDFEMCHYRLEQYFPNFMQTAPRLALPVGLTIANDYIIMDRSRFYENIERVPFMYGNIQCVYIIDFSSIWNESIHYHKPADLINRVLAYIEEQLEKQADDGIQLLKDYIQYALVGYSWKQLLALVARHPKALADFVYPLLITPTLLTGPDTSYEARVCIEECVSFFTDEQVRHLEELIWASYDDQKEFTIRQALSRIPAERLQLVKSQEFIAEGGAKENERGFQSHFSSETYTTDMWLTDQGVDVEAPENRSLLDTSRKLEAFNNQWMNHTPPVEPVREVLPYAKTILEKVTATGNMLPKDLIQSVLREAIKALAMAAKILEHLVRDEIDLVNEGVKYGYGIVTVADDEDRFNTSPARGWSPTPRNEAADALVHLYIFEQSENNLQLLEDAVKNGNSVVRYNAVRNIVLLADHQYAVYWKLITDRLAEETDSFTYAILIGNLKFYPPDIQQQAPEILNLIEAKEEVFISNTTFLEEYIKLLLWMMQRHKIPIASKKLWNAYSNPSFCRNIIFTMFERMHPSFPDNDYVGNPELYKEQIDIILHYADKASEELKSFFNQAAQPDNPELKGMFTILDEIILRIYFQLDAKRLGNSGHSLPVNQENRKHFYFRIKPVYEKIITLSGSIPSGGMITGHTAHYFIQSLNLMLADDPEAILEMITTITTLSLGSGYTFDSFAIQQMVELTEKLLADHRDLLLKDKPFKNLIELLDIYIQSGWVDALQLLWKLDEVFK